MSQDYKKSYTSLAARLELYAADLAATAELDALPEGDMGWRYNSKAGAETLCAMLDATDPRHAELPGVDDQSPKEKMRALGCGDSGCLLGRPPGMATNGGCKCAYIHPHPSPRELIEKRRLIMALARIIKDAP